MTYGFLVISKTFRSMTEKKQFPCCITATEFSHNVVSVFLK